MQDDAYSFGMRAKAKSKTTVRPLTTRCRTAVNGSSREFTWSCFVVVVKLCCYPAFRDICSRTFFNRRIGFFFLLFLPEHVSRKKHDLLAAPSFYSSSTYRWLQRRVPICDCRSLFRFPILFFLPISTALLASGHLTIKDDKRSRLCDYIE